MQYLFLFLSLILSSASLAGPFKVGNGGGGVIAGRQVYLLDLVESGNERLPYINRNIENIFLQAVEKKLDRNVFPTKLISIKLSEIYEKNKVLGLLSLQTIESMEWNFINYNLEKTDDLSPIVSIDPALIVQIANRRFSQVSIVNEYWFRMPLPHQTALVFHEVFYTLIRDYALKGYEGSIIARNLTSLIFSPLFENYDSAQLNAATERIPGIYDVKSYSLGKPPLAWLENKYWTSPLSSKVKYFTPELRVYDGPDRTNLKEIPLVFESDEVVNVDELYQALCTSASLKTKTFEIQVSYFRVSFALESAFANVSILRKKEILPNFDINQLCEQRELTDINLQVSQHLKAL